MVGTGREKKWEWERDEKKREREGETEIGRGRGKGWERKGIRKDPYNWRRSKKGTNSHLAKQTSANTLTPILTFLRGSDLLLRKVKALVTADRIDVSMALARDLCFSFSFTVKAWNEKISLRAL